MLKFDGHTHTELCPHGSGEPLSKMVERAIALGFTDYGVTEHAPLPKDFAEQFGGDPEDIRTASLSYDQIDDYLDLVATVRRAYAGKIKIHVGFELDWLAGYEAERRAFLDRVGPKIDRSILSLHYLKGDDGRFYGVDYTPAELIQGFGPDLGDGQALYRRYLREVARAITWNFGPHAPRRLGHLTLIKKYQDVFGFTTGDTPATKRLLEEVLNWLQIGGWSLDFNTAGLYKPGCNDFYPGAALASRAKAMGIPLVFGSDAHAVAEVGRAYHLYENFGKTFDFGEN